MSLPQTTFQFSTSYDDALHRAAAEWGIEGEFWDIFGNRHTPSPEQERRVLSALGLDTGSQENIDRARLARLERELALLPPSVVVTERAAVVPVSVPAEREAGQLVALVTCEDGREFQATHPLATLTGLDEYLLPSRRFVRHAMPLPTGTPLGYHRLTVRLDAEPEVACHLAVTPESAVSPGSLIPGGRTAGLAVTLYGLRSARNWGCGDFTDLKTLLRWLAQDVGCTFVALNPLHALHNRTPFNTSPYLPLSIFYKNLIYIDVTAVPEYAGCRLLQQIVGAASFQARLASLREAPLVMYEDLNALKKKALKLLYREFRRGARCDPASARARAFQEYVARENTTLDRFALYCALDEQLHKQDRARWTWRDWPGDYQQPDTQACHTFAAAHPRLIEYYKYIQFVLDEQLAATQTFARQLGMPIGLYHDLALATDSSGADLWAYPAFFVSGCRVGAPPDAFSPDGQDWAFPPPNAATHRENGYALFRNSMQQIMAHGGALRIDHVMRLFRLFWIPNGLPARDGLYVKDHADDLLRILALESVRHRNLIVGEDLGTVTDQIRASLSRHRILSYRLLYFEKLPDHSFRPPADYPVQSLVSSTTHDLPTIAGFWANRDIEARHEAGFIGDDVYREQLAQRRLEKQRMLDALHREQLLPDGYPRDAAAAAFDGALHNAIIGFLARTPAALMLLNQEDLTKEELQQNLPGSTAEYPNWRRKMQFTLEQLTDAASTAQPYIAMFRAWIEQSRRRNHPGAGSPGSEF